MRKLTVLSILGILLYTIPIYAAQEEGYFWQNKEKNEQGWKVMYQDYSHIKYKAPTGIMWTRCHSCFVFIPLENAHQLFLDRTEQNIYVGERKINYEELYYCDKCFSPDWIK